MSKDFNLQIQISYDDVSVERIIASRTTIRVDEETIVLDEKQIANLYKALTAYAKADGIEL